MWPNELGTYCTKKEKEVTLLSIDLVTRPKQFEDMIQCTEANDIQSVIDSSRL